MVGVVSRPGQQGEGMGCTQCERRCKRCAAQQEGGRSKPRAWIGDHAVELASAKRRRQGLKLSTAAHQGHRRHPLELWGKLCL